MIGSGLLGNIKRLRAIQEDFHSKVGKVYGLKRGTPARRYSRAARTSAADRVINVLRKIPNKLDDPAIRDALRDVLAETMPVSLMTLLSVDVPEAKAPKSKTFAAIMIKKFKPEKPIDFQSSNHIELDIQVSARKIKTYPV